MKTSLRNIKLVLTVDSISSKFQKLFKLCTHNLIMKMKNCLILTIYLSQIHSKRIHVTGIKRQDQKYMLINFLEYYGIKIKRIQINSSFFLLKDVNIPEYDKFANFCSKYQQKGVKLNLSSFNIHENFLSVIYLKVSTCSGIANLHRKSIILLACRKKRCVEILKREIKRLLISYIDSLKTSSLNSN